MFCDHVDGNEASGRNRLLDEFYLKSNPWDLRDLRYRRREMPSQAEALILMEEVVDYILQSPTQAYKPRSKAVNGLSESKLGKRLRWVYPLHTLFDSQHDYSEKPAAFLQACWHVKRVKGIWIDVPGSRRHNVSRDDARAMNMIVELIRQWAAGGMFLKASQNRRVERERNGQHAACYVTTVLNCCVQADIVLLDCCYEGLASAHVTIDRAWNDVQDFIQELDNHRDYHHLAGHVWSMEQCRGDGFHVRVALLFNGSRSVEGIDQGNVIGDLWKQHVTQGRGRYSICSLTHDRPDGPVIGTVRRDDELACVDAVRCIQEAFSGGDFLDRDGHYLRVRRKSTYPFGTGPLPDGTATEGGLLADPVPWLEACMEGSCNKDNAFPQ